MSVVEPDAAVTGLDGKVALVTGGGGDGGSGLGAAIAEALVAAGASVVVTDVRTSAAEGVAARIRAAGGDALALALDVTDDAAWSAAVAASVSARGALDVLVSSAGVAAFDVGPFDLDAWDHVVTTNMRGAFLGMRHAIPVMVEGGGGAVVNITSSAGSVGVRGMHMAYGASKAAIRQMTRSAAAEFGHAGVRVNALAPGMLRGRHRDRGRAAPPAGIPLGRLGHPAEIARAAVFLLSDATYVTGAELVADGGYLVQR